MFTKPIWQYYADRFCRSDPNPNRTYGILRSFQQQYHVLTGQPCRAIRPFNLNQTGWANLCDRMVCPACWHLRVSRLLDRVEQLNGLVRINTVRYTARPSDQTILYVSRSLRPYRTVGWIVRFELNGGQFSPAFLSVGTGEGVVDRANQTIRARDGNLIQIDSELVGHERAVMAILSALPHPWDYRFEPGWPSVLANLATAQPVKTFALLRGMGVNKTLQVEPEG
jgi:hypothetical protein